MSEVGVSESINELLQPKAKDLPGMMSYMYTVA